MHGVFWSMKEPGHAHPADKLAKWNGLLTGLTLYPQLFKVVTDGGTQGLSRATFLLIAVNSVAWLAYAWHRRLPPLIVSAVLNLVASVIILAVLYS